MEEEQTFSLGNLDSDDEYTINEEIDEQEEQYSEDITEIIEESSEEESNEVEELNEESEEVKETEEEVSYSPFLDPLVDEGILIRIEDKEYDFTSPEVTKELIEDTLNYRDSERIAQLPEVLQQVFELAKLGEDPMNAFQTLNTFDYSQIDLEDVDTQKELVKDYLMDKFPNLSSERLTKKLQDMEDLGDLEDEAKDAQSYFIEKDELTKAEYVEQVKLANQEAVVRQEQEVATYKKLINDSEGFAGLKFTSNQQKSEFERYCFERGKDGLTQYERETMKAEDKMTQAFYTFNKYGFKSIEKKAKSDAVVEQKKILKRFTDMNSKSNKVSQREVERPNKGFSLGNID